MVSKFGIEHLWWQGDEIIRGIAIVLLLMSIASWIVILIKLIEIGRVKLQNRRVDVFWHSEDVIEGIEKLGNENDNPFAMIARNAHIAANHLQGDNSADNKKTQLHDKLDPSEWIGRAINQAIDRSVFNPNCPLATFQIRDDRRSRGVSPETGEPSAFSAGYRKH